MDRSDFEIIISDDGSNEIHRKKLIQIKEDFAVEKVFLNKHKGMGNSFNTGLRVARGKYVLHLEDDWEMQSDGGRALARSLAFIEQHPEVALVRLSALKEIDPLIGLVPYGEGFHKLQNSMNAFSKTPHLKRKDFHKYSQWFKENCSVDECEQDFASYSYNMNLKVCWGGNAFNHFGVISTNGCYSTGDREVQEILYDSLSSRDDLLNLANEAMKANDLFVARHALEKFEQSGECDAQVQQSLEIVREICGQTECVG